MIDNRHEMVLISMILGLPVNSRSPNAINTLMEYFEKYDYFKEWGLNEELKKILYQNIVLEKFRNYILFKEGQRADFIYFIWRGEIELKFKRKTLKIILRKGKFFGEMAILTNRKRTATARSKGSSLLVALDKIVYLNLLLNKEKDLTRKIESLRKFLFKDFCRSSLLKISFYFNRRNKSQLEYIFKEGEKIVNMFLLVKG